MICFNAATVYLLWCLYKTRERERERASRMPLWSWLFIPIQGKCVCTLYHSLCVRARYTLQNKNSCTCLNLYLLSFQLKAACATGRCRVKLWTNRQRRCRLNERQSHNDKCCAKREHTTTQHPSRRIPGAESARAKERGEKVYAHRAWYVSYFIRVWEKQNKEHVMELKMIPNKNDTLSASSTVPYRSSQPPFISHHLHDASSEMEWCSPGRTVTNPKVIFYIDHIEHIMIPAKR